MSTSGSSQLPTQGAARELSIGYHVGKLKPGANMADSIVSSVGNAKRLGVDVKCVQIFVMGPQSSHLSVTPDDAKRIRELTAGGLRVYVHSAYITANIYKPESSGYAHVLCRQQLELCNEMGASGFVIHVPRDGPETAAKGYRIACKYRGRVPIFMEIEVAKPPKYTYETPEKIAELCKELAKVDPDYGICIDTAHLWSCGESLGDSESASRWFGKYSRLHVPHTLIHLNDSGKEFGSGMDSHMAITHGNIWKDYDGRFRESGAYEILQWARREGVDVVLERDEDGLVSDLGLIRKAGLIQN